MAQQCNGSVEHRRRQMILSAAGEAAVIETASLRHFQGVRGSEARPSLRVNFC